MIFFLTSSPFAPGSPDLNPANGFVRELRRALPSSCSALFVCADPRRFAFTDRIARDMRCALENAGFFFSRFRILDGRTEERVQEWAREAELIVLAGGHVPTQNAFFQKIALKAALASYDGVLLGISAGSMNCADPVYAQPEEEGEAVSPEYRRFLPGLGISRAMILPHYQAIRDDVLDGLRLFADITLPDSRGRTFYAIPDGSYLLGRDGAETLHGEAYRIQNGALTQICREEESLLLPEGRS